MQTTRVRHFDEGRACDAVLRFLEHRRGGIRRNLRFPEREDHEFPVDLVCDLNGVAVAIEHTGTEPFEGYVKLQAEASRRVQPLIDAVALKLPPGEDFYLDVRLADWATLAGKEFDRVCQVLAEWIVRTAPSVPIAPHGRRVISPAVAVPGVLFPVGLNRMERYPPFEISFHLNFLAGELEAQRLERMRRTLRDKCPKLAGWRHTAGAETILVLEWSDFQVTNQHLIADALLAAETEIDNRADAVYMVATLDDNWCVYTLRSNDETWFDIEPAARAWDIPKAILQDITARDGR